MKLDIELIPKTAWRNNLRNIVGQRTWDMIRKQCYKDAGYRCEICNGKGNKWPVECHERWEFNNNTINLLGFIALCPSCHMVKHMGLALVNGNFEKAKSHFMKINGLSSDEADEYIEEAFKRHHEQSKEEWEMNLDLLQEYQNL